MNRAAINLTQVSKAFLNRSGRVAFPASLLRQRTVQGHSAVEDSGTSMSSGFTLVQYGRLSVTRHPREAYPQQLQQWEEEEEEEEVEVEDNSSVAALQNQESSSDTVHGSHVTTIPREAGG